MGKILLTGGAGLIGANVAMEMNRRGRTDIIIVDKLGESKHKWRTLSNLRFADYMEFDAFEKGGWKGWIDGVDTVVHCGAKSATTEQDAAFLMANNFAFSKWLAEWALDHGARFVYASSAATYGADTFMIDRDDLAHLESLRPLNAYGYSKALFDIWMAREGRFAGNNAAAGLKYTNVYGPFEYHKGEQRSLVCKAYDSLRAGKPIELFESADPRYKTDEIARDFLYVEDAAKVTVWFALDERGRQQCGLFNVGSGVATSFTEMAQSTAVACAEHHIAVSMPCITYIPMPEHLRGRYQYHTCAPIRKLREAGYTDPFMSAEEGVRRYVGVMATENAT